VCFLSPGRVGRFRRVVDRQEYGCIPARAGTRVDRLMRNNCVKKNRDVFEMRFDFKPPVKYKVSRVNQNLDKEVGFWW
jgi:hypothetical protein